MIDTPYLLLIHNRYFNQRNILPKRSCYIAICPTFLPECINNGIKHCKLDEISPYIYRLLY